MLPAPPDVSLDCPIAPVDWMRAGISPSSICNRSGIAFGSVEIPWRVIAVDTGGEPFKEGEDEVGVVFEEEGEGELQASYVLLLELQADAVGHEVEDLVEED